MQVTLLKKLVNDIDFKALYKESKPHFKQLVDDYIQRKEEFEEKGITNPEDVQCSVFFENVDAKLELRLKEFYPHLHNKCIANDDKEYYNKIPYEEWGEVKHVFSFNIYLIKKNTINKNADESFQVHKKAIYYKRQFNGGKKTKWEPCQVKVNEEDYENLRNLYDAIDRRVHKRLSKFEDKNNKNVCVWDIIDAVDNTEVVVKDDTNEREFLQKAVDELVMKYYKEQKREVWLDMVSKQYQYSFMLLQHNINSWAFSLKVTSGESVIADIVVTRDMVINSGKEICRKVCVMENIADKDLRNHFADLYFFLFDYTMSLMPKPEIKKTKKIKG